MKGLISRFKTLQQVSLVLEDSGLTEEWSHFPPAHSQFPICQFSIVNSQWPMANRLLRLLLIIISNTSPSLPWPSIPRCIFSKKAISWPSPSETHFMILSASCLLVSESRVRASLQQNLHSTNNIGFSMPESGAGLVGELSSRRNVLHVKSLTHLCK